MARQVVIPSVPGYGFSGKPTGTGWGPDHIARAWAELMKRLGYTRYVAQGGDWGTVARLIEEAAESTPSTQGDKEMSTAANDPLVTRISTGTGAEQRLKDLHITLPAPPTPFGSYAEAVQTGNLLFLSGMLPTDGRAPAFVGRVGAELDVETAARAARLAALNAPAVAREHLGSLDRVTRVVRLGVSVATSGDVRDQPKIADAASKLLQDVFGEAKNPCRLVYGVASLPLGAPVEVEVIFEVAA